MNNEPDGFLGAVIAAQGVKGLKAMINGPGGCRSRTMNLLREMILEYRGDDSCCCRSKYMSRVSMLPCTFLNADDIILGSAGKITDGLKSVIGGTGSDVVLVDTLGATVQVVDRERAVMESGYAEHVILADDDLSSMSVSEGFDDTMVRILARYVRSPVQTAQVSVNVLGYTIADRSWDYGKREISRMLISLGVSKIRFIGCDSSVEELAESSSASLNVLIHPEFSIGTAKWYRDTYGVPYLVPSAGSPIGFDSVRSFLAEVADALKLDPSDALKDVDEVESHVIKVIQNYDKLANSLRGCSMVMKGLPSDLLPISSFLYDYFNLVPKSVALAAVSREAGSDGLERFLESVGLRDSIGAPVPEENVRVIVSDGYSAERCRQEDPVVTGVGILFPYPDTVPLTDHCLVGISGTLNLLDQLLNGLQRFTCGQPTACDFR